MFTGKITLISCSLEHVVLALSVNHTFHTKLKCMSLLFLLDSQDCLM